MGAGKFIAAGSNPPSKLARFGAPVPAAGVGLGVVDDDGVLEGCDGVGVAVVVVVVDEEGEDWAAVLVAVEAGGYKTGVKERK